MNSTPRLFARDEVAREIAAYYNLADAALAERMVARAQRELDLEGREFLNTAERYALEVLVGNLEDEEPEEPEEPAQPMEPAAAWYADFEQQILACAEHARDGMVAITVDDAWELTPGLDEGDDPAPETACHLHH